MSYSNNPRLRPSSGVKLIIPYKCIRLAVIGANRLGQFSPISCLLDYL